MFEYIYTTVGKGRKGAFFLGALDVIGLLALLAVVLILVVCISRSLVVLKSKKGSYSMGTAVRVISTCVSWMLCLFGLVSFVFGMNALVLRWSRLFVKIGFVGLAVLLVSVVFLVVLYKLPKGEKYISELYLIDNKTAYLPEDKVCAIPFVKDGRLLYVYDAF